MELKSKGIYKYCVGFILGAIVFGSAGVLASTYILKSSDIKYNESKSVQEAVEELYTLVGSTGGGSYEALFKLTANGTPTSNQNQIVVNFNKVEPSTPTITCKATSSSGTVVTGVVSDNTCTFSGLIPSTKYTYEILRTDQNGTTNSITGNKTTTSSGAMLVTDGKPTGTLGVAYLDPTNLSNVCNASNSTSTTGTKSGCMKWYVYAEDNDSYTMILDHNTTAKVNHASLASSQLSSDTTGWTGDPRLITKDEIVSIAGTSFKSGQYYWLYDYTKNCTSYGCKVADSSTGGYWTSTYDEVIYSAPNAWYVGSSGQLSYSSLSDTNTSEGVRPVITISKSNF